jgi:hypothetical protein
LFPADFANMADANEPVFEDDKDTLRCRFYENQYPEPEEVVMCNVTEIGEMGAYVTLLEYDNVEVISWMNGCKRDKKI